MRTTIALLFLSATLAQAAMSVSWQTNSDNQSISLMSSADTAEWLVVGTVESVTGEGGLPAPIVSGEYVIVTNTTTAQIAWDTDLPTSPNIIDYGTVDGEFGFTATATDGRYHSATITGLSPGTAYQWRVRSYANAQWAISQAHWLTTPSEAPPPSSSDLTNGMFAYFNFDDSMFTNAIGGMALTKSGNITNSTINIAGQSAGGFTRQSANYLAFPTNSAVLSPMAGRSLFFAGWFRPGEVSTNTMALVSKATLVDPQREYYGRLDVASNTVAFTVYPNGTAASAVSVYASQNIPVQPLNWYMFGFGYSVPAGEIYATIGTTNVDTPLFAIRTNTVNFGAGITTTRLLTIGQMSGGAFPFNGRLDEYPIWTNTIPSWETLEAFRTNTLAGRSYPSLLP